MTKLIRFQKAYDVDFILKNFITDSRSQVGSKNQRKQLTGDEVGCNSLRLRTFKIKGIFCVTCGIKGDVFYKEKTKNDLRYHLNLYAINSSGHEVLMTKDHIIPKSKGGLDRLDNMQPMCTKCNSKKGNRLECSM